jgi:putative cell wall-binding protein
VAITGTAVYVGGHFRWQNNPLAGDRAGPGAVSREGIAALDPANGLPLSWNPGRTKGVGVFDMLATPQGLWVGSDTDRIGHFSYRARIALMPLAGGTIIPPNLTGTLPGEVYQAGRLTSLNANDVVHRSFDGDVPGSTATLPPTGIAWSNARGAVMIRDVVYYGWSDGNFYSRTFDGMNFGPQTAVNTHDLIVSLASWHSDIPNITSMFFQGGRLYYTLSNSSSLFYRYFTPENRVVGTLRFTASNSVAGVDFSQAGGAFLTGDKLYLANRITGALTRVDFVNSAPVAGTATVVSGPALDGADWRTRALFLSTVGVTPPANQPPVAASNVTCTGLDCIVSGANSTDPDGSIESYTWNFGDGTTGSGVSTTHSYAKAGTYQVQLTVTDNQGATNSTTQTVAVAYNAAFDLSSDAVFRVQGPDRVATAIDASQFLFGDAPSGAEAVVLARSDLFPDALAGVPLAAASTGPLLITPPTQLDSRVAAEIQRILPLDKPVYLLGGTGALSQAVEDQVKALGYTTVTRLAGPDRFATALAIAVQVEQVVGGPPFVVLVATGQNFPDALAAGAAAGIGGVVVLSNDATLPQPVRDYVVHKQQVDNALVVTVGGPAVPSYPEADAAISGADRYQTAALVADVFFVLPGGEAPVVAGLATGANFPDALSGGAVMALLGGPMLLTNPTTLNAHPQAFLAENRATIDAAFIFGGSGAVSNIVDGQVAAAIAD